MQRIKMDKHALRQELEFQANRALQIKNIEPIPDYVLERYKKGKGWRIFPKEYVFRTLENIRGKHVLDFGCGDGVIASQMAKLGAFVTGIDISPHLIEIARRRAQVNKVENRTEFLVGDVRELDIPVDHYDFLVIYEVLHHIDDLHILSKLFSALKSEGQAIIVEPIICSSVLDRARDLLPLARNASPGERQLTKKDLTLILGFLRNYQMEFYLLFGRLSRFFPHANDIDQGHVFTKIALYMLNGIDRLLLLMFPELWRFYGIVVILGQKNEFEKGIK